MKVVLFCGGFGTRLKEFSETIPKPMVEIGYRPIMWHLMRYYAHYGIKDFILCLGYRGDVIKNYFLNYNEAMSNNFILSNGGREVRVLNNDIEDWTITFVDTGLRSNIGQRLKAVERYLDGEEWFMANYSDGLSDLNLPVYLDHAYQQNKVANFLCVQPSQSFHIVEMGEGSLVSSIHTVDRADLWINGGFFVFKHEIFDYMKAGEELVHEPFHRLIAEQQLIGYRHSGFWACMDTLKEKMMFDELYARGQMPWAVWEKSSQASDPLAAPDTLQSSSNGGQPAAVSPVVQPSP